MVFCSKCKFYKCFGSGISRFIIYDVCSHRHNIGFYDNYAWHEMTYDKSPAVINKKNDCPYYTPKFSVKISKFFLTSFGK